MVPNLSSKIDILPDYTLAPDEVPLIGSLVLEDAERDMLKSRIAENLERQGMALVAHYYVDGDIQDLAEQPVVAFLTRWKWRVLVGIILPNNWW